MDYPSGLGIGHAPKERPSSQPTVASGRLSSMRGRWAERNSRVPTIIPRDRAIEKAALAESAERIYLRYLLPGAEREIYLPYVFRAQGLDSSD